MLRTVLPRAITVVLGMLAIAPASSSATYAGADGRIAFAQDHPAEGYGTALFSVEPDGTDLRQLTDIPGSESQPSWSADGQRITFTVQPVGNGGTWVYTMRADGSEQRPLVRTDIEDGGDAQDISPTFTPDGNRVVYSTRTAIRSIGVDGTDPEKLYRVREKLFGRHCCVSEPAVSPDGKRIAFVRAAPRRADSGLWTMNRSGKKLRRLSPPPPQEFREIRYPDFSPDGEHISFQRGFVNRYMRLDDLRLKDFPSGGSQVSLSPSGDFIVGQEVVVSMDGLETCSFLFTQGLSGGERSRLTGNCDTPSDDVGAAWPSWQPVPTP